MSLTETFDIEFPLFAFSHCRDVVAAVSRNGGFGVLGAVELTPDNFDKEVIQSGKSVRSFLTVKRFAKAHPSTLPSHALPRAPKQRFCRTERMRRVRYVLCTGFHQVPRALVRPRKSLLCSCCSPQTHARVA